MSVRFDSIALHNVVCATTQERYWTGEKRWTRNITVVFEDGSETSITLFKDGVRSIPLELCCAEAEG